MIVAVAGYDGSHRAEDFDPAIEASRAAACLVNQKQPRPGPTVRATALQGLEEFVPYRVADHSQTRGPLPGARHGHRNVGRLRAKLVVPSASKGLELGSKSVTRSIAPLCLTTSTDPSPARRSSPAWQASSMARDERRDFSSDDGVKGGRSLGEWPARVLPRAVIAWILVLRSVIELEEPASVPRPVSFSHGTSADSSSPRIPALDMYEARNSDGGLASGADENVDLRQKRRDIVRSDFPGASYLRRSPSATRSGA